MGDTVLVRVLESQYGITGVIKFEPFIGNGGREHRYIVLIYLSFY